MVSAAAADGYPEVRLVFMWICRKCGEPHQDQFKECWKCVGAEMEDHTTAVSAKPLPTPSEPRLRSLSSILVRAGIGFMFGMLLSWSSLNLIPRSILPDEWI